MTTKTISSVQNFFIFNSLLGPKEGEEEQKILFYYPEATEIDTKIKAVGLCEAVIKFVSSFNQDKQCQSIHTQKTRQIFLQTEPDFWMVLTATVPHQQKTRDGHTYIEYYGEEVQDHVLRSSLVILYRMFRLFSGTFEEILHQNNPEILRKRIYHFFSKHIQSMRLHQHDLLDVFNGMLFLPLERHTFLKIKCFLNLVEGNFSQIKYTCFLYNDQLVWSGLEQEDMQVLYRYLTVTMIPSYLEPDVSGNSFPRLPGGANNYAKFMTGPLNWDETSTAALHRSVPKVNFYAQQRETCHLIVYRALSATVCLLVDGDYKLTLDFFKELDSLMSAPLTALASEVGELYAKTCGSAIDSRYLYMYFNRMNLAQKSSIHPDIKISPENMKLLSDFNLDLSKLEESGEIMGKTVNDCWLVARFSDKREFYAVLPQKNASIMEVAEELRKLNASQFQNLFVLE